MDIQMLKQLIDRYCAATFIVNRKINAHLRDLMPEEITVDQFSTMQYIRAQGRCTSSELADIFCVGKSSITAIITRLFDKELIMRLPDEKDRRVTYLTLTDEGKRLTDEMESKVQNMLAQYISHFSEKEAIAFIETYEKLAAVLVE
jgi:DNA-binding MarR family transcriptional regulator